MPDMSQHEQPARRAVRRVLGGARTLLPGRRPRPAPAVRSAVNSPADGATSLWRMRTTVPDRPGTLARLCGALGRQGIDVVSLQTFPLGTSAAGTDGGDGTDGPFGTDGTEGVGGTGDGAGAVAGSASELVLDEFVLRAPAEVTATGLVRCVDAAGGRATRVERGGAHDLADTPTRVLRLATRTARDSAELPLALRQLLGRCTVRSVPSTAPRSGGPAAPEVPPEGAYAETVLRLPDPAGGVLVIERPQLPFTPAEFARAAALVELDRVLGAGRVPRSRDTLTLPHGSPVTVQRADTADLDAALRMHGRCSRQTLARRYHGPVAEADRYLRHLLSPRFGRTLAAWSPSGQLVALGHLLWDGDEAEVALLVEDEWQRRGIGGELLRRLVRSAAEAGHRDVYAVTQASNTAMTAAMRSLGLPLEVQVEEGTLVITVRTAGVGSGAGSGADVSAVAGAPAPSGGGD